MLQRECFRVVQNFINAAARLDGACRRQMAVHLEKELARRRFRARLAEPLVHARNFAQRRLDQTVRFDGLGEFQLQKRRKTRKSCLRVLDLRRREGKRRFDLAIGLFLRIYPEDFLAAPDGAAKCRLFVAHDVPPV